MNFYVSFILNSGFSAKTKQTQYSSVFVTGVSCSNFNTGIDHPD